MQSNKLLSITMNEAIEYSERFLNAGERAKATCELADTGEKAIPILRSIFDGTAKNSFGISYSKLGMPLSCAIVACGQLGAKAESLINFINEQVALEHPYAVEALEKIAPSKNT